VTGELRAERHWVGGRLGRTSWRQWDLERLAELWVGRTLKYLRKRDFSHVDVGWGRTRAVALLSELVPSSWCQQLPFC